MASTTDCLTLSGVKKSGSPIASEMMSLPCAFNSVARWLAALLGDCLMRPMRDAMIERGFMSGAFIALSLVELDVCLSDNPRPFFRLGADKGGELFRRVADHE